MAPQSTVIKVSASLTASDPSNVPVIIVGQQKNIGKIEFEKIACKLGSRVSSDHFKAAQGCLAPSGAHSVSLYLNRAMLVQLPSKCSRHNTPSQAHALTKAVSKHSLDGDECFVVVCERRDVFASACALARAFPLYSRKSSSCTGADSTLAATVEAYSNEAQRVLPEKPVSRTVNLEFLLISGDVGAANGGDDADGGHLPATLSADELVALHSAIEGVRLAARLVDTPCGEMDVCAFVREAEALAKAVGCAPPLVIRGDELRQRGLGGLWSVGRAAQSPPALVVLSHRPKQQPSMGAAETIAWVGKGIVYDTGGLCLKPRTSMLGMKGDCGGAAAVLAAFGVAVRCGFAHNLHAVLCLAENAIGPLATRPDDVIAMYSGKSVEVNNTDAEGRLVLADGVVYARRDLGANIVLDIATLTSAQLIATGRQLAAVVTNSSKWEEAAAVAGRLCGDLTFPLPYVPELHFKEFSSAVADMKNSAADRQNAQSSCAGLFINSHLGFDFEGDWIHVDMAGPSVDGGERATGYGVALLTSLFGGFSTNDMIKALSPFKHES